MTTRTIVVSVLSVAAITASPSRAFAEAPDAAPTAFDRTFAFGVYGTGWAGAYAGVGGGARLRWEPFDLLGVEVFAEGLVVDWQGALRHDYPIGFNLYMPIEITRELRFRPLFGFCAVFSFIEPPAAFAPRADDIMFGIHAGAGLEYAIGEWVSLFLDVQAVAWLGHDRANAAWSAGIEDSYTTFGVGQVALGALVHFGD